MDMRVSLISRLHRRRGILLTGQSIHRHIDGATIRLGPIDLPSLKSQRRVRKVNSSFDCQLLRELKKKAQGRRDGNPKKAPIILRALPSLL